MRLTRIPVTVVTGFLGAGKTSLVRHLLATAGGRRIALVINEFGPVAVDGDILRGCGDSGCAEADVVELANGCLCCTVADDFVPTLGALIDRPAPPDHIVVETSGLALPKPLVAAFQWPEIRSRATVDGVVTVVDAEAVAAGRFASDPEAVAALRAADEALDHESPLEELFEEQMACADIVVLNKTDLLDAAALDAVEATVRHEARAGVPLVRAEHGRVAAATLLGLGIGAEDDLDSRPSHHDGAEPHDHDDFESHVIAIGEIADPAALETRLADAVARFDLLRAKGFAAVSGKPMRLLIEAAGPRIRRQFDRPWAAAEPRDGRLVVIGPAGLDADAVGAALRG